MISDLHYRWSICFAHSTAQTRRKSPLCMHAHICFGYTCEFANDARTHHTNFSIICLRDRSASAAATAAASACAHAVRTLAHHRWWFCLQITGSITWSQQSGQRVFGSGALFLRMITTRPPLPVSAAATLEIRTNRLRYGFAARICIYI